MVIVVHLIIPRLKFLPSPSLAQKLGLTRPLLYVQHSNLKRTSRTSHHLHELSSRRLQFNLPQTLPSQLQHSALRQTKPHDHQSTSQGQTCFWNSDSEFITPGF